MTALSNEKICRAYFQGIGTETEDKIVKNGNLRTKGNGWTNLMDRIKSAHPSFREELGIKCPGIDSNLSMDSFITYVSVKARNINCWMQWVVNRNRPLTFVEESESRSYSNLQPISRRTLAYYVEKVCLILASY